MRARFFVFTAYQMAAESQLRTHPRVADAINVQFVKLDARERAYANADAISMGKITKNGVKIRIIYPYATVDKLKKLFRDLTVSHKSYNDPIVTNFYAQLGQFLMRTTNFKRHEMAKNRELNQPDKLGQQLLSMKTLADRDRLEAVLDVVTKNRELFPPDILESLYGTDTGRSMEAVRVRNETELLRESFEKAKRRILELNDNINQSISTRDALQKLVDSTKSRYFVSTTTNHEQTLINEIDDKIKRYRVKRDKIKHEFAENFPTSPYIRITRDIAESSNSRDYEHQFNENVVRSIPIEPNRKIYAQATNLKLNVVLAATGIEFIFKTADSGFTVAQLNQSTLNALFDGNYITRDNYDNIQIALQTSSTDRPSKHPYELIVGDNLIDKIQSITTSKRGPPFAIYDFIKHNGPKKPMTFISSPTVADDDQSVNRFSFEQIFTIFAASEKLFRKNIIEYFTRKYLDHTQQPQQNAIANDDDDDDDDAVVDDMITE